MELRQLEAFVAVAEDRNFTRAAARLFIAQSGLSATIRTLEHELDAELFVRTTRRVDLTAAGTALLPEARRTLASATAATQAVQDVASLRRGTVQLGVMQANGLFNVGDLLADYRRSYPGIEIRLRQASSTELRSLLVEGVLDIIFATAPRDPAPGIVSLLVARSPLVIVSQAQDVARSPVRLASVAERPLVNFPPGWGVRTLADRALQDVGVEPRVDLEVNDTTTLLDLVEAGLGIAVVPDALAQLRASLGATAIADGTWHWIIAAQILAPEPINPAGRALWDMINQRLQNGDHRHRSAKRG